MDFTKINHQTWMGNILWYILVRWHCFLSLCFQLCCVCPSAGQNTSKSMQFCDTTWANNSKHDIYLRLLCDDWTDFCVVCMFVLIKSVFVLLVFLFYYFFYFSIYLFMLFSVCSMNTVHLFMFNCCVILWTFFYLLSRWMVFCWAFTCDFYWKYKQ